MAEDMNYSLADIGSLIGNRDNQGVGDWLIILILFMLGGGGLWGNNAESVSNADLQRGFDTSETYNKLTNIGNGICDGFYAMNTGMLNAQSNIGNQINDVKYSSLGNTNAILQSQTENTQKILDTISSNKIEDLQSQINQLQLQNAVSGVVRYPMASTYTSGTNPFCNNCYGV